MRNRETCTLMVLRTFSKNFRQLWPWLNRSVDRFEEYFSRVRQSGELDTGTHPRPEELYSDIVRAFDDSLAGLVC